ncbi:hypothetical protein EMPS_00748 [Entomortierella parvispora]|uniref:Eisosome component PIL1-domain-containing protein n=1 Tax=Entomortierella parvispora TaxID=205924 RepID=A0A9P3H2A4_9FUNG|nr:hypothetical protein EMPS_00748 [Entomortierella parvispora]
MDLLGLQSHLQDSARRAAGSFLSPLTNAIGEQRRLIDSLAVVSKVRVEECKHMMDWSKTQTDDLGDVLLKLNLLIRKISDYEIRFGTQYESFREKIKYLRTKDDSLCEMGRRQSDLQQKILEASKSRLRTAKAKLLQTELDQIQKESAPTETKLQHLKRQLIKGAYTEELNAIIELGKKMQIIGEHGMQLLDHIDLPLPPGAVADGRKTEDILQAARIALENWDQLVMVDPQSVVVHPPPPPPPARSMSEVSQASVEEIQTLAVKESRTATASTDSASEPEDSDSDVEFVQAPTSPLKAKPSVALSTDQKTGSSPDSLQVHNAEFASTLAPKLTLTPNKNSKVTQSGPTLPPRTSDWASEAAEALASVQIKKSETKKNEPLPTKKLEALPLKIEDTTESEAETLRRLEELEIKHALELSLAEAAPPTPAAEDEELRLTAEELRFVMGDVVPKRSTKVIKRQARAPETTDGDTPAISKQASSRVARAGTKINTDLAASASASEAESEDLETPKASKAPRVLRGPQATDPDATRVSQQGPRPWVEEDAESVESTTESEDIHEDIHEELSGEAVIPETLGDQGEAKSSKEVDIPETMGPEPEKPLESMGQEPERPLESMGGEAEQPLESMGNDQAEEESIPFVPMPQVPSLDAIRQQKIAMKQQQQLQQQQQMAYTASPEPQHQSVQSSPQPMHQHTHPSPQPSIASLPTPKTAYAQISSYQSPIPYQPSTAYVPQASKQKNRLSGSHTPPQQGNASPGSSPSPQHQQQHHHASGTYNAQYIQQQQQYLRQQQQQLNDFYYQPHEQEYNQQQYQLYQQQLREQRQREGSVSSVSSSGSSASLAPLGWNIPRVNQQQPNPYQQQYEQQYQQQQYQQYQQQQQQQQQQYHQQQQQQQQYHQQQQQQQHERPGSAAGSIYEDHQSTSSGAPSPSPSHISLVPDNSSSAAATPVMASVAPLTPQGKTPAANKKPVTSPHAPSPDDYKVEVK